MKRTRLVRSEQSSSQSLTDYGSIASAEADRPRLLPGCTWYERDRLWGSSNLDNVRRPCSVVSKPVKNALVKYTPKRREETNHLVSAGILIADGTANANRAIRKMRIAPCWQKRSGARGDHSIVMTRSRVHDLRSIVIELGLDLVSLRKNLLKLDDAFRSRSRSMAVKRERYFGAESPAPRRKSGSSSCLGLEW